MKILLITIFLFLSTINCSQAQNDSSVSFVQIQHFYDTSINLSIPYKPATIKFIKDTSEISFEGIVYDGKFICNNVSEGSYKIYISGPEKRPELKDSFLIKRETQLVLNIKINGPC